MGPHRKHQLSNKKRIIKIGSPSRKLCYEYINDPYKQDPWDYLEREMRAGISKKPYNKKVGAWLVFLKELHNHFRREADFKFRRINMEVGPSWYIQFCSFQKESLKTLKADMYQDLIENYPTRVSRSLLKIGITTPFLHTIMMASMEEAAGDPGLFIWYLYQKHYKKSPSVLQKRYNLNQMLMISCLVFIDYDDCIMELDKLTPTKKPPPAPKPKPPPKYFEPKVKYGVYLQKMKAPCNPDANMGRPKPVPPPGLDYKMKLRSAESYERLCADDNFLKKRKEKNEQKEKEEQRICKYKFWEPPVSLHARDPKMAAYVEKLKLIRMKARPTYLKHIIPYNNVSCHLGTVTYAYGHPRFVINTFCMLPTGYMPVNKGAVKFGTEYVTHIEGFAKYFVKVLTKCEPKCVCMTKWEARVIDYLNESKCKCHHRYDFLHEGRQLETYFHQASKHGRHWFDKAKIYQMDPTEDFIRDTVAQALDSRGHSGNSSRSMVSISGMKLSALVRAFLADLSSTALILPHLPQANHLESLQAWARKKISGKHIPPDVHKKLNLITQRRWLDLHHMDFRARAYLIPFKEKELNRFTYKSYEKIQELTDTMLSSFVYRNRRKIVQQSRLWWSTMRNDVYPSDAFLDVFFTYMPIRMHDIHIMNPYNATFVRHAKGSCGNSKSN